MCMKIGADDDDDDREGRGRGRHRHHHKRPRQGGGGEESLHMMDELTSEKGLQCRVTLAEINRKLGVVMFQPM